MEKIEDFARWAEKMAELARQEVQVERFRWHKREADQKLTIFPKAL